MTITHSSTRFVTVAVGVAVAFSLIVGVFATATPARAATLTQAQISAIISLLQSFGADAATVANVTASLNGQATPGTGGTGGACPALSRDLQLGSSGADVKALQMFLNSSATTQVASAGAGSPGNESTYFGSLTKAAAMKFQAANNVSPIAGYVGPITRAAIAAVCGKVTPPPGTTPPPVAGTGLSVTAAAQPANGLAPAGASRIPFTNFTLTAGNDGDVTVNSVTVQRTGVSADASFSGVELLDAVTGVQIGITKTLNSNHQAVIGATIVIPRGTSRTFTVAANRAAAATHGGEIASFAVVAINTTATVTGSLPITGASHTINETLTLGSVTINTSSFDPNTAGSQPIGTTAFRFSGLRITAGSAEDLTFKSVMWNQSGSASASDLANVVTVVNGTSYPTTVSADGKYFTTSFPSGITIGKGNSIDVYIQGDVVGSGAAGRVAEFDIYKNTDLYLTGNLYGYGVTAAVGSGTVLTTATHITVINTSSNPWFQGSTLSITAGSVTTISKASEVPAQNIAVNVPNQPLGGYATNFSGEPVSVASSVFTVASTTGSGAGLLTNVSIVDENGLVVAGPVDATYTSALVQTLTFTDTITYPVGRHVYTIKGKVASGIGNGGTYIVTTTPSSGWTSVTGQTTGNSVSLSGAGIFTMNTMTVKAAALTVNLSTQPAAQTVVAGVQGFTLGNYQLDASQSGEDIRLSSFPVLLDVATVAATSFTGCQLWQGNVALNTGSRVINTWTDNTFKVYSFDSSLMIPKGTIVTLAVKCDVSSAAGSSGTIVSKVDQTDADYSISGVTSGNSVTVANAGLTLGTSNGSTMTMGASSMTVTVDSSSPSYKIVSGGSTGVTAGVFKIRATNEALSLTKLGLTLTATSGSGNKSSDLVQVYLYSGSTLVGTATFTGSNTTATSTLSTPAALAKDADTLITVKADVSNVGTSQAGTEGDLIKIDPLNAEASGASSGTTVQSSATAGVAGMRLFNTFPTIALDTLSTSGIADGKLMRFTIKADSADNVGLYKFVFLLSTTTVTLNNFALKAYTDSSYTSPVGDVVGSTTGQIDGTLATSTGNCLATYNTVGGSSCTQSGTVTTLTFKTSQNALQVPASGTRYLELTASVAGVATGASVVTTLQADAAFATSTATGLSKNFVWSPNATSTQNIQGDDDWTDGFTIAGFPSSGLSNTRGI